MRIFEPSVRYLVTSEFLAYSKLMESQVIQLLKKNRFGICLCVHQGELNEELHQVCKLYEAAGIPVIFWPLLSQSEGLYLNKYSIKEYSRYLDELFQWLEERKLKLYGLLVDCEPEYEGPKPDSISPVLDNIWHSLKDLDEEAFNKAIAGFQQIIRKIRSHKCKAIGAALPFACNDALEHSQAWQDYWGGPVAMVDWDVIVFMLFGSWFVQMGMNWPTAHYLVYDYAREIKKVWHNQTVVALGVTTPGTGAETCIYKSPDQLAAAVSVVKAAGIKRIGIYDLKGILDSPDPQAWLVKVKNAPPLKPDGHSLPESNRVEHFKVVLYHMVVDLAGKLLEMIRTIKGFFSQLAQTFKGDPRKME